MSLQDWDEQGKTRGLKSTFTIYGHDLQECKDYDPAADDYKERRADFRKYSTLNFLKNINKYVKRAEGLGKIHRETNWGKMYTISSGRFYWNKERLSSIKSMIDSDKQGDFDTLLDQLRPWSYTEIM